MFHRAALRGEEWEASGSNPWGPGPGAPALRALGSHGRLRGRSRVASRAVQGQTGMGRLRTGRRLERKERRREDRRTGLGTDRLVGVGKDGARGLAYDWVDGGVTPDMDPRGGGREGAVRGDPFLSVGRGECEGHIQVQVERSPGRGQVASVQRGA